ncbi:bifunctional tRNA (5-methylaminomethyl-2-thiouridine)(34)-methyltransferase MnmD/FAD-dependent 5-carboxymethylaminomethyl-2-thiouridine(34) oxidoreductase MnmC [Halomonas dongshanensis]|uniref:tRNA 5-methylaminomethyl-2-thiouridine biosynthesis bifunctional protein MnmC n=1 Tax=Halomonas dongshanensis TaxID=2890835 RepID=A0ABT2EA53_9GAMM|nr:bifunctional tRNA (5-methylaminomethyl-2-thiouridine)(34)-methyltransferase MnmD/FAD-dependent 5-carboxymethylaminomethyl-2-thiouridine(34) oxidoreductase MnmC [Halomonas dongshanensis]
MTHSRALSRFAPLPPLTALSAPTLSWNEAAPHSDAFGDVYFSREDGRAETEHVFLNANRLPERFTAWPTGRPFVVGETGFGTGLNMLCAWTCFEAHAAPGARLHLVSTEKFPLPREALARALGAWPSLSREATRLLALWPEAVSGIHRLQLTDRVTLDLHFGDTTERLGALDGQVDAWFLDGFAPSKNPQMWSPELFAAMAARSRPGATFATFTCAGIVKRGLKAAGFAWRKVPGFGRKREMLAGEILIPPEDDRRAATPWFTPPPARTAKRALVIGAGIAGASVAQALARRGIEVEVIERDAPGAGGSGNRQGALYVKLAAETNDQSRVYLAGLLYSQRWLNDLAPEKGLWSPCGVHQRALDAKEQRRQQRFIEHHPLPTAVVAPGNGELHYPQAGWVRPKALCDHLLDTPGIRLIHGTAVALDRANDGWRVMLEGGRVHEADHVIIASAHLANGFAQTQTLPLQPVRGQISEVGLPSGVKGPDAVICAGGYVAPALEGVLTFGASFIPNVTDLAVSQNEHQGNIEELKQMLPELVAELDAKEALAQLGGRVAIRAASPDKTPYAGPVPDAEAWKKAYAVLSKDATRIPTQAGAHHAGLWITAAHGSRGLASAPLCAEVIASRLCDEPMPLEGALIDHLHPGRRLISALKRAQ